MRILLVVPGYRGYAAHYRDELAVLGHEVSTYIGLRYGTFATRARNLLYVRVPRALGRDRHDVHGEQLRFASFARRIRRPFDLALFVNTHPLATDGVLDELRSRGIPTGLWMLDDRATLESHGLTLSSFDLLAAFGREEASEISAETGVRCEYVPQGLAPIRGPRNLLEPASGRRPLVLGAPYPRRRDVAMALAERDEGVHVVGNTWSKFVTPTDRIGVSRDVSLAQSWALSAHARTCVHAHRSPDTGVSPRVFEIAGAGGLLVTDNAATEEFFDDGVEMLRWDEPMQAVEHATWAMRSPGQAARMAQRARSRVFAEHLMRHRFARLLRGWGL